MWWWLPIVLLAGCGGGPDPFATADFESAQRHAAETRKIVVADFYTTWCGPCKELDRVTWKDAKVRAWLNAHAVSVKVDAEKFADLAKRHRIRSYPTILLLSAEGKELDRLIGFRDAKAFLAEADDAVAGRDAVTRARAALVASREDLPSLHHKLASALSQKGRPAEALREYLVAFDRGGKEPAFVGVRASFMLSEIADLGSTYPPALAALRQRRDRAEAAIRAGRGERETIGDFHALCDALKDGKRTLRTYDELARAGRLGDVARQHFLTWIRDDLLEAHRYAELVRGAEDPVEGVRSGFEQLGKMEPFLKEYDRARRRQIMAMSREWRIRESADEFEAWLGAGRTEQAGKIADTITAFDATGETFALLITRALRAGSRATAESLASAGLKRVPFWKPGQRRLIRDALAGKGPKPDA